MSEDAPVAHVSAGELEVGIADPGPPDAEEHLAGPGLGRREIAAEAGGLSVAKDAEH